MGFELNFKERDFENEKTNSHRRRIDGRPRPRRARSEAKRLLHVHSRAHSGRCFAGGQRPRDVAQRQTCGQHAARRYFYRQQSARQGGRHEAETLRARLARADWHPLERRLALRHATLRSHAHQGRRRRRPRRCLRDGQRRLGYHRRLSRIRVWFAVRQGRQHVGGAVPHRFVQQQHALSRLVRARE